ncbi:MAG: SRPBCC family protein, partial [Candidatus Zixiibacteriota bacterium]
MKLYTLQRTQKLPISLDQALEFFSNPQNLALITPPSLNLKPVSDVPERMYPGMIVVYRVKPFLGLGINWVTEITQVRKPNFFVDEQR